MAEQNRPRHASGDPRPGDDHPTQPIRRPAPPPTEQPPGAGPGSGRPTGPEPGPGQPTRVQSAADTAAAPADPGPATEEHRPRWRSWHWKYIYGTRIRSTTALLAIAFVVCTVLYGYTAQRYGVVAPPPPQQPRTTQSTPPAESPSSVPSSRVESSTAPSGTDTTDQTATTGPDGSTGDGQPGGGSGGTSSTTVPGLPGVTVPNFGRTQTPQETQPAPQFERRQNQPQNDTQADTPTTSPAD